VILQMHPRHYFNRLTQMSYHNLCLTLIPPTQMPYHNLLFDSGPPSWYSPFTWNEWKILYWEGSSSWNWCHVQEKSL
jgi:hypothetical protein